MVTRRTVLKSCLAAIFAPLGALAAPKAFAVFDLKFGGGRGTHVRVDTFEDRLPRAIWHGRSLTRQESGGWCIFSGRRGKEKVAFRVRARHPSMLEIDWMWFQGVK